VSAVSSHPAAGLLDRARSEAVARALPGHAATEEDLHDFAELYDAYARFVWRALVRLGVAPRDAEDVTQEVFLVVFRQLHGFRRESTVRTWVYGITLRVARNVRRAGARRPRENDVESDLARADSIPDTEDRAPDAVLRRAQAAELVIRLLDGLDPASREVFVLAELEEMTAAEIGEILELSPNTVSSRLRAARRAFAEGVRRSRARDEWRIK
jgi:RNA polymerase sigma-70 factor, ECF subfamily